MAARSFKRSGFTSTAPKYDSFLAGNDAYVPPAFESIATATGTGSSGTITFSSIPSGYVSLQIRGVMRNTDTGTSLASMAIRLNGSTSVNDYAEHYLSGNASAASAGGLAAGAGGNGYISTRQCICPNDTSSAPNIVGAIIIDLHDYASTTRNKTVRTFSGVDTNGTLGQFVNLNSGLYLQTTAVTSISLINFGSNWGTTTQFALYGIKGA